MVNDWMIWKGVDCREMGCVCVEQPPVTSAKEKLTFEKVAGRSGTVILKEGDNVREDMTMNCTLALMEPSAISDVIKWLHGSGRARFASRPDREYDAVVSNQIEMTKVIAARDVRTFPVSFRAQPWAYHLNVQDIEITESGTIVNNPGTASSVPRITVYGSGSVALRVGGQLMTLRGIEDGIILDSQLCDALTLDGAGLLNGHVTGEFFEIQPGASAVSWGAVEDEPGGTVTRIVITPRWRDW